MQAQQGDDGDVASSIPLFLTIFLTVFTAVGNLIALLVLGQSRQLRSPAHFLMANLAALDFLTGGVVMTFTIDHALNAETMSPVNDYNAGCQLAGFLRVLSISGSSFTLVALSYERYVAIIYPLKHTHMITTQTAAVYSITIWILAVFIAVMPFWGVGKYQFSDHQLICWPQGVNGVAFVIMFLSSAFAATFLTMILMYILIMKAVRRHRSIIHALVLRIAQGFTGKKVEKFRATRTITLVLGVFFISWIPFTFTQISSILASDTRLEGMRKILAPFLYVNCASNPWIYCGLNATFRSAFKKKLHDFLQFVRRVVAALFYIHNPPAIIPEHQRVVYDGTEQNTHYAPNIRFVIVQPSTT
ncbi:histamine H2 receptor-like [Asterias rubens]|uniref:histamine H2 receptor-like n=1 Tax=Asterias rubens TaxID=7604 RepID=UPI0014557486|nr:histamine H2 receptor-like [Asterias rubens]